MKNYFNILINENQIGLFGGASGCLLGLKNTEEILIGIQKILDSISNVNLGLTFSDGLIGIGWLTSFLSKKHQLDNEELLNEIDSIILNYTENFFNLDEFDFLHGGLGGLLYFIEREKIDIITILLDDFEKKSITFKKYKVWQDNFTDEKYKKYKLNLSLSHGMASVLAIYNILYDNNILKDRAIKGLNNLFSFYNSILKKGTDSFFPDLIIDGKLTDYGKRLSWCYGDLGVLYQLLKTAHILNDSNKIKNIENKLITLTDFNISDSKIKDACFCHGSIGIAYIFYKTYKITRNEIFKGSYMKWLKINEEIMNQNKNKFYRGDCINYDYSLLEGEMGLRLVKDTINGKIDSSWDRVFLLS